MYKLRAMGSIVLSLSVGGCATLDEYKDPSDVCYSYRQPLISSEEAYRKRIANYVAAGVGAGLATALTAKLAGVDDTAVLASMAIAAALGTATYGYYKEKASRAQDLAGIQSAIDGDARAFRSEVHDLSAAINGLSNCRQQQVRSIQGRFKSDEIDRVVAQSELASVRGKINQDNRLIETVLGKVDENADIYVKAKATSLEVPYDAYVARAPAPGPGKTYYIAKGANLRAGPSTSAAVIYKVSRGTPISITKADGSWYTGRYKGSTVYVYHTLVSTERPATQQRRPQAPKDEALAAYSEAQELKVQASDRQSETDDLIAQTETLLG